MALHPAYAQVAALLAAVTILTTGNGLLQTLVPPVVEEWMRKKQGAGAG